VDYTSGKNRHPGKKRSVTIGNTAMTFHLLEKLGRFIPNWTRFEGTRK